MNNCQLQQELSLSVQEVLEKMFFFSPPDSPAATGNSQGSEITARVTFRGDPPGELMLRLAPDAARSIASDFLAAEVDDLQPDQIEAVVCELANMICGSVLSRVESSTIFHLDPPCIVGDAELRAALDEAAVHTEEMFGGALMVAMKLNAPTCAKSER